MSTAADTPDVWCVRADFGKYATNFKNGSYVAIGWLGTIDLATATTRTKVVELYRADVGPSESNLVVGQQAGQINRFLLEMKSGDFVITPTGDTEVLLYGCLTQGGYAFADATDGCPYRHRRPVQWLGTIRRSDLSVPFQNTIRSYLTVFWVSQRDEFFKVIQRNDLVTVPAAKDHQPHQLVLAHILELDDKEFEHLVKHLLVALGFDGSEAVGKSGDGGVDVRGELNMANLAKIRLFVQAKRYKVGNKITGNVVKQLRAALPAGAAGAFVTTSDFQENAHAIANETGFPRIGLINGRQLVDLLVEHWDDIPKEFQDKLGLKRGLVPV